MKKLFRILFIFLVYSVTFLGCTLTDDKFEDTICNKLDGHQLYKNEDGRCYYIGTDGKVVTVAESECDC